MYRIRAVDGHDDEIADTLAKLDQLTFFDAASDSLVCAKALIPKLRDRGSRTEELRRLPLETEHDLHNTGLFRIVQPKRVGGSELDYVALVDCADALGAGRRFRGVELRQPCQPSLDAGYV